MTIAFGTLILGKPLELRKFEKYFKITSRKGLKAWQSVHPGIQKLLNHLSRYTKSESSREKYLQIVYRFCIYTEHPPDMLISLPKTQLEELIQSFVDELAIQDRSRAYLNSDKTIKNVLSCERIRRSTGETLFRSISLSN